MGLSHINLLLQKHIPLLSQQLDTVIIVIQLHRLGRLLLM